MKNDSILIMTARYTGKNARLCQQVDARNKLSNAVNNAVNNAVCSNAVI